MGTIKILPQKANLTRMHNPKVQLVAIFLVFPQSISPHRNSGSQLEWIALLWTEHAKLDQLRAVKTLCKDLENLM